MKKRISATEAARNFSDLLNRVKYAGEEFVVERAGEPMCRIVPPGVRKCATLAEFFELLDSLPRPDPGFAEDVRAFRRRVKPAVPKSRWES